MHSSFKRKLTALNSPQQDNFDDNSDEHLRTLVCWLEEMKIRAYKVEDRTPLRTFDENWAQHFSKYLSDIECPYAYVAQKEERLRVINWLLSHAISLEYLDNSTQINESAQKYLDSKKVESHAMEISSTSLDDPEFQKSLSALASTLNLPPHENPSVLLSAVVNLLHRKFSPLALQEAQKTYVEGESSSSSNSKNNNNNSTQIDPSDFPLGFDTKDEVLNKAATVLRLLYIADMRELQTKINDLIVIAQSFTANPKTNTRIGKIGK